MSKKKAICKNALTLQKITIGKPRYSQGYPQKLWITLSTS